MDILKKITNNLENMPYEAVPFNYGFLALKKSRKIKFSEKYDENSFCKVFDKLTDLFGIPVYADNYYGYIWKAENSYVAYNLISEGYDYQIPEILLFDKLPKGEKLPYAEYVEIEEKVKKVFEKNGFEVNKFFHYFLNGFNYIVQNDCTQCIFTLKKTTAVFYRSDVISETDKVQRIVPLYSKQFAVGYLNPSQIEDVLEKCFEPTHTDN